VRLCRRLQNAAQRLINAADDVRFSPIATDNCVAANVLAPCFIIDLPDLGGAEKIRKLGVPVRKPVSFEGH